MMIRGLEEVRFFFLYLTGKGECSSTKSNLLMRLIRNGGIDSLLGSEVGSEDFFQGWGWGVGWVPPQPDCFKLSENRKSKCTTDFGLFLSLYGP